MDNSSGGERRVSQDEQLGYIRGKVESIQEELNEYKGKEDYRLTSLEELVTSNSKSLASIERSLDIQANTHKYVWLTIKSFSAAIFLVLTVKFGDIINLLK